MKSSTKDWKENKHSWGKRKKRKGSLCYWSKMRHLCLRHNKYLNWGIFTPKIFTTPLGNCVDTPCLMPMIHVLPLMLDFSIWHDFIIHVCALNIVCVMYLFMLIFLWVLTHDIVCFDLVWVLSCMLCMCVSLGLNIGVSMISYP